MPAPRAALTRTVYVTVTDGKGAFATDLTPADFTVKEGGKDRTIVSVEPAGQPDIALLVEQGLTGDINVRQGLLDFFQRTRGAANTSFIVVELRNKTVVDYTTDFGALFRGLDSLYQAPGLNHHVAEGIYEASRALAKREAPRRIIVVAAVERQRTASMQVHEVLDALRQSGATLYAVTLYSPAADGGARAGSPAARLDQAALGQVIGGWHPPVRGTPSRVHDPVGRAQGSSADSRRDPSPTRADVRAA